jgi:hypothetical protein
MDMWRPFRNATQRRAPQASILFDTFHVLRHLGDAFDTVRKGEYARLSGTDRRFIKGPGGSSHALSPSPSDGGHGGPTSESA